jgi:hypothetical protein
MTALTATTKADINTITATAFTSGSGTHTSTGGAIHLPNAGPLAGVAVDGGILMVM